MTEIKKVNVPTPPKKTVPDNAGHVTPTFATFAKSPAVQANIAKTLGDVAKAKTFTASLISAVSTNPQLATCDPTTIVSSALLGESLNLSPSPQLGQYYMVPFKDKATFVLGWKGYYQLAMRSGVYKRISAVPVKEGELKKYDPINEVYEFEAILDPQQRINSKTVGYYAYFETTNGFRKEMYWTREQMEHHATTYSKGYSAHKGYTFWEKDFDAMALKTMYRQIISKYGVMSIELQRAVVHDETYTVETSDGVETTTPVYMDAEATSYDVETGEIIA